MTKDMTDEQLHAYLDAQEREQRNWDMKFKFGCAAIGLVLAASVASAVGHVASLDNVPVEDNQKSEQVMEDLPAPKASFVIK